MNTTPTTNGRNHKHIALAIVTTIAAIATGSAAAADPPPWEQCAYRDHPAAADLGPLVPSYTPVPAEVQAVLLGDISVGTDCSIYDLPV